MTSVGEVARTIPLAPSTGCVEALGDGVETSGDAVGGLDTELGEVVQAPKLTATNMKSVAGTRRLRARS